MPEQADLFDGGFNPDFYEVQQQPRDAIVEGIGDFDEYDGSFEEMFSVIHNVDGELHFKAASLYEEDARLFAVSPYLLQIVMVTLGELSDSVNGELDPGKRDQLLQHCEQVLSLIGEESVKNLFGLDDIHELDGDL